MGKIPHFQSAGHAKCDLLVFMKGVQYLPPRRSKGGILVSGLARRGTGPVPGAFQKEKTCKAVYIKILS